MASITIDTPVVFCMRRAPGDLFTICGRRGVFKYRDTGTRKRHLSPLLSPTAVFGGLLAPDDTSLRRE